MKLSLAILLMLSFSFSIFGQESRVYTDDGVLRIDNSYSIKTERLEDFKIIEEYAFPIIYNLISYPAIASENGIDGVVIIKIVINGDDNFTYSIEKSEDNALTESVKFAVNKSSKYMQYLSKDFKMPFEFYIPIKFELNKDTFEKDLETNKAITVKGTFLTKEKRLIKN